MTMSGCIIGRNPTKTIPRIDICTMLYQILYDVYSIVGCCQMKRGTTIVVSQRDLPATAMQSSNMGQISIGCSLTEIRDHRLGLDTRTGLHKDFNDIIVTILDCILKSPFFIYYFSIETRNLETLTFDEINIKVKSKRAAHRAALRTN